MAASATDEELLIRAGLMSPEGNGEGGPGLLGPVLVNVCRRGYVPEEVRTVLDSMWEAELPYDSPDAVVEQLELMKTMKDPDAGGSATSVAGSNGVAPWSSPIPAAETQSSQSSKARGKGRVETKADTSQPAAAATAPAAPGAGTAVTASLVERLQAACSHPSITNALSALQAWAAAASPEETAVLFTSSCQALEMLFENVLSQPATAETDALLRSLMGTLLPRDYAQTVLIHLQAVRDVMDRVVKIRGSDLPPLALSNVAKRVAKGIRHCCVAGTSQPGGTVDTLAAAAAVAYSGEREVGAEGVRELFALREDLLEAMNGMQQACARGDQGLGGVRGGAAGSHGDESEKPLVAVLMANSSGVARLSQHELKSKRSEVQAVQAEMQSIRAKELAEVGPLQVTAGSCAEELRQMEMRRAELAASLASVEEAIRGLQARHAAVQVGITNAKASAEAALASVGKSHAGLAGALQLADECERLEAVVGAMEGALSGLSIPGDGQGTMEGGNVMQYLSAVEGYLGTEIRCLQFLRGRKANAESTMSGLRREMSEYAAMGMESMAKDISNLLGTKRQEAEEDEATIGQLLSQAQAVFAELQQVLARHSNWQQYGNAIAKIKAMFNLLGAADTWSIGCSCSVAVERAAAEEVQAIFAVKDQKASPPRPAAPPAAAPAAAPTAAPVQHPAKPKPSQPAAASGIKIRGGVRVPEAVQSGGASLVGKLNWATMGKPAQPIAAKSVLDIQAEEQQQLMAESSEDDVPAGPVPLDEVELKHIHEGENANGGDGEEEED
ncbi:unnamed protein product [Chrysoparadoxa australica]